ncbi:MAG: cation:proton antiporter [Gammaproteobacteria bacterium]|nr:cation:proton antiporter [Gammaproteobacteria bacterium]
MNAEYLTDIIILLTAAVITVPLFQFLKIGAIPGFLVAGIMIGPSGLGYIESNEEITHLAELGVVLLLFVIGIEINPSRLWNMKGLVLGLGSLQVLITGGLITLIVHEVLGTAWNISLLIGLALSLSSTAFVLQLLTERKLLSSEYGRPSVSVLLLQDLAVVPLLAFVSLLGAPELTVAGNVLTSLAEAVIILLMIILSARYILNPLLNLLSRFSTPEIFTASALLLVLGSAWIMESVGLSMAMGAFIAGLLIADSSYRHQIVAEIQPFRGLLLGLFFMAMGLTLNLELFLRNPLLLLIAVVALMAVKFITLWLLSLLFGIERKPALSVALLLTQSGEFALVLFALAKGLGLLDEALFQQLLIVVILSMLATPVLEKLAHKVYLSSRGDRESMSEVDIDRAVLERKPVILIGFGRMGKRVAFILDLMEVPYVAIDNRSSVVERERAEGRPVYFGDAQQPEVLRAVGAADTPFLIVSIDDLEAAERVVSTLHSTFPNTSVFARAHDLARCRDLKEFGAYFTVSETVEASAELARVALLHMGSEEQEVEAAVNHFRKDYYGRINTNVAEV